MRDTEEGIVPLHQPFEVRRRGYDQRQVLDHIEALEGHVRVVAADRDAALDQIAELKAVVEHLRSRTADAVRLREERDTAVAELHRIRTSPMAAATERIADMLTLAQDEADEVRARAERQADEVRADARAEGLRDCDRHVAQMHADARARIGEQEVASLARLQLTLHAVRGRLQAEAEEADGLMALRQEITGEVSALEEARSDLAGTLAGAHQRLAAVLTALQPGWRVDGAGTVTSTGAADVLPAQRDTATAAGPDGASSGTNGTGTNGTNGTNGTGARTSDGGPTDRLPHGTRLGPRR